MPKKETSRKEPMLIMRPVSRMGLDYLHISLIVLVIVLVALAFGLSTFKGSVLISNCTYGYYNNTCAQPIHNMSQVTLAAEKIIASYSSVNSTLALLPYYSEVNLMNVSYIPSSGQWLVVTPYLDPLASNSTFYLSLFINDSTLSLSKSFIQTIPPYNYTQNHVVALGVVSISGRVSCGGSNALQVYNFIDPYAPGALEGFTAGVNATARYGSRINVTYDILFTPYAVDKYAGYGLNETQNMGEELFCATKQPRFPAYLANYSLLYNGNPLPGSELNQVAVGSGLNMSEFNTCMNNSSYTLNYQARLGALYHVVSTPTFVVDCQYSTIPATLDYAVNYALNQS